jgi:alpha/beta superfamily hydrolase
MRPGIPAALPLLCALLCAGICGAQGNEEVNLSGTVTDLNGAALKDAKVLLVNRNLSAITDAAGKYSLGAHGTALNAQARSAGGSTGAQGGKTAVELRGNRLEIRVGDASPASDFTLYTLSGKRSGGSIGPGAPLRDAGLGKSSAVEDALTPMPTDTLSITALGYERGERSLDSYSGTQDFKLGVAKLTDVPYKTGALSAVEKSVCVLDVHKPSKGSKWPVLVYLHGGGLVESDKSEGWTSYNNNFAYKFLDAGILVVSPNYRLIGKGGTWPGYLQDAAAAAAWARRNIESYGGDPENVFVGGWSAGAYLTQMLFLDTTWFNQVKYDAHRFRGFIAISGQPREHANLAGDLHVTSIMAEKPYAVAMGHIHKTDIPFQIFVGSKEGGTITDNQALYDALLKAGSTDLQINIIPDHAHNDMGNFMGNAVDETRMRFLAFIDKYKGG